MGALIPNQDPQVALSFFTPGSTSRTHTVNNQASTEYTNRDPLKPKAYDLKNSTLHTTHRPLCRCVESVLRCQSVVMAWVWCGLLIRVDRPCAPRPLLLCSPSPFVFKLLPLCSCPSPPLYRCLDCQASFNLVTLGIDRLMAIADPLQYPARLMSRASLSLCLCLSLILSLSQTTEATSPKVMRPTGKRPDSPD
ncbi:hypothetical protein WMY93_008066 [Mugilogobius chulae]|uniref:Uncharacterized protein n=1 Tax=Mugilogobius chulae TaxID=88201 RepID=A0AAW0PF16_9GOBI